MTVRLVGLMSVVLLLSLAAFGLLMGYYQDQVMQEVARTASAVGRATLSTFESPGSDDFFQAARENTGDLREDEAVTGVWKGIRHEGTDDSSVRHVLRETAHRDGNRFVIVRTFSAAGAPHLPGPVIDRIPCKATDADTVVTQERDVRRYRSEIACQGTDVHGDFKIGQRQVAEFIGTAIEEGDEAVETAAFGQIFISLEDVRAEADPVDGNLTLRIPRFTTADAAGGERRSEVVEFKFETDAEGVIPVALAKHDELHLPIPIGDYEELFARMRSRSLFLFLGVFAVGMVLSTGLATRFTRPIRRLDAGIRRISEGDLDAEVDAAGKDEIARLGRAFNEMTSRLREGRDRNREIVRREKLSALGGLAAGVAHDVRNPLHSINLTLQHMAEACRPEAAERSAEFDEALDVIRGEIARLDQLIGNFLRFARTDRRERQPMDLAALLRETASLIKKEAEWRKIDVELDINEAAPSVSIVGESVRSSVLNLVLNSFEAMPEGGKLTLRLGVEGASIVVEVADTGKGIPEEDREKVFEFAYTTREGGSGLGLAMVHHCVVEEHGGRILLDSEPGRGTRVRLLLPIRVEAREGMH